MGKLRDRIAAGKIAEKSYETTYANQQAAQGLYDSSTSDIVDFEVPDYYQGLEASTINTDDLAMRTGENFEGQAAQMAQLGRAQGYQAQGYQGEGYTSQGYTARGTNVGNLQRGAAAGLSNVFNNLQVSTAGAEMAAQEADQSLAASQDLAAQAGTGAGGATALAAAAARSKQGISADIDRQVKANEQMRAQGEQGLQRDMLAQGNLASQFNLGQSQFNVGAQNRAAQFGASAANQASQFGASARNQANQFTAGANNQANQFNAGQKNQFALSRFGAQNQINQFNVGQGNAERMAEFGALSNANAANASAINNAIAQNSSTQTSFDLAQAGGQTQASESEYGQLMDVNSIYTEQLNNANVAADADEQIMNAGNVAQQTKDRRKKFWRTLLGAGGGAKIIYDEQIKKG
jgi:hypothetical protein